MKIILEGKLYEFSEAEKAAVHKERDGLARIVKVLGSRNNFEKE